MENNELALRQYQEAEGEILAEIIEFEKDMIVPLEFISRVAKMKNYKQKSLEVVDFEDGSGWYDLRVNGTAEVNIVHNEDDGKYSAYDGVDGYGWHDTIKQAVKYYMDSLYGYHNPFGEDDDDYEVSCTNCGDGGCWHCEPSRFI